MSRTPNVTHVQDCNRKELLAVKEARYFAGRHASAWQSRLKQLEGEGLLERHVTAVPG